MKSPVNSFFICGNLLIIFALASISHCHPCSSGLVGPTATSEPNEPLRTGDEDLHPYDHRRHHRHNTDDIFWQRLRDQVWAADLANPCRSGPNDEEPEHLYNPELMVSSLNIDNREEILRAKAGNLLFRLRHLERFVPLGECESEQIASLPRLPLQPSNSTTAEGYFTPEVLEKLYNAFLYISAHYRFMWQDWQLGTSCYYTVSRREALIDSFQRAGHEFEHGMCMLLAPVAQGAPYPNGALLDRVYAPAMDREILHYIGHCAGRIKRDCIVHRYATNVLEALFRETNKIVKERRRLAAAQQAETTTAQTVETEV